MNTYKIAVVMGSDSDLPALMPCFSTLTEFGVQYTARVISAHRTPAAAEEFAKSARGEGYRAIIAAAGKAAHLAGVIAAHTTLPVIGIPVKSSTMDGLDSLLSVVQMPAGIPVATVAIDGAANAALLAVQIIASGDAELGDKLAAYKKKMADGVMKKDAALNDKIAGMLK